MTVERSGPLAGLRVIEIASIGPSPFCNMLLSDLGAEILRLDRPPHMRENWLPTPMQRGRSSVAIDLKAEGASALVLDLAASADILVEGFRPGVMERLGLGPDVVHAANPKLVYGRMTGWGQSGPRARLPGHDINYIATTGVLAAVGKPGEPPVPPLNLAGDFCGALFLAFGLVSAVLESRRSGKGQVVDAAMVDASASLMSMFCGMLNNGSWTEQRGTNVLDGGAPFYSCYEARDGKYVAIGTIESRFFEELVLRLGLAPTWVARQYDRSSWPAMRAEIESVIHTKTRDEWSALFADADSCLSPVLTLSEASEDPHNVARGTFVKADGLQQPTPAPRFSRTPGAIHGPPKLPGADTLSALREWGCDDSIIAALTERAVIFFAEGAEHPSGNRAEG